MAVRKEHCALQGTASGPPVSAIHAILLGAGAGVACQRQDPEVSRCQKNWNDAFA